MDKVGIVAFSFGAPSAIPANQHIARIARNHAIALKASIYTQPDIQINNKEGVEVLYTHQKNGNPPPTLRIARRAVQWAHQQGIKELLVVAAEPHLWRCVRDLKYASKEARMRIHIRISSEPELYPEEEWFCANSTQERTQSKKNWERQERILRHLPMFLYKRIAS